MSSLTIFSLFASAFGILVPLGAFLDWAYQRSRAAKIQKAHLNALSSAVAAGEIVLVVGIGGSSIPESDVANCIRTSLPGMTSMLVYQAPATGSLGDPHTALRVAEDLQETIRQIGEAQIARVHFFLAGMLAYTFLVGALFSSITKVVVYQKDLNSGTYVPLYEWNGTLSHNTKRSTRQLAKLRTVDVGAPPFVSAAAAPAATVPVATVPAVTVSHKP